jgi:pimeloyl-ACP methyl ester carboxylesterase
LSETRPFPKIDGVTPSQTSLSPVLPHWPGRLVHAAGCSVYVRQAEPDQAGLAPALFVHGLGGSAQNWTDLMGGLRDLVDGEAVDLPGFGQSPPPAGADYSISAHAGAVIRLLELRDRGPVHLFGNSLGGSVAVRVTALRPDLVRTLTLISPALPHLRPRLHGAAIGLYAVPGFGPLIGRFMAAQSPQARVQAMLDMVYADPGVVPDVRRAEAAEDYLRRDGLHYARQAVLFSLRGVLFAFLDRGSSSLWRQAAQVQLPTLLIYGQRDKIVDPRTARRALGTFPDARLVVLPNSGHVAMMEHPHVVERAFREFLQSVTNRVQGG